MSEGGSGGLAREGSQGEVQGVCSIVVSRAEFAPTDGAFELLKRRFKTQHEYFEEGYPEMFGDVGSGQSRDRTICVPAIDDGKDFVERR